MVHDGPHQTPAIEKNIMLPVGSLPTGAINCCRYEIFMEIIYIYIYIWSSGTATFSFIMLSYLYMSIVVFIEELD